jgi:hypothetical protein
MADATAEQHADLAVLVAATLFPDAMFRAWARNFFLSREWDGEIFATIARSLSKVDARPAACTAWTAVVTAKSTTESELLAFVELTLAQAFRAGLTKDALSMAIDAALSGEAPRFLDAMGKK